MKKPFVPFDSFERGCLPDGKSLAETMQENCKDRLAPKKEPCRSSCLPYWQKTGESRCLDIGLLEVEEADGCGNTRWTRTADRVIWELTDEERCDEPNNRIQRKQINQCGGERWVTTSELCCTPMWVNVTGEDQVIDCTQSMERRLQEDGCGHTRLRSTGQPVNWVGTGEVRCDPGDVYQVEQINQCGETRWITVPGGCPCIPDWQPSGPERCTGYYVERQETDGCGHTRWQSTGTQVMWTNTGETRCNGGFIQRQQVSQCGTTRWETTEEVCTSSPEPVEITPVWSGTVFSDSESCTVTMRLDATTGRIYWRGHMQAEESAPWVTGAFDRQHYEGRITVVADETEAPPSRVRSGTETDTWFNLGDMPLISNTHKATALAGAGQLDYQWTNVLVRLDVRKVDGGIVGGMTFGPFVVRAT